MGVLKWGILAWHWEFSSQGQTEQRATQIHVLSASSFLIFNFYFTLKDSFSLSDVSQTVDVTPLEATCTVTPKTGLPTSPRRIAMTSHQWRTTR